MIYLFGVFILLSAYLKSVMDRLSDNKIGFPVKPGNKFFGYKSETWTNKYKNNDPNQGEKFLFSTTLLVSFTDLWHLIQSLYYFCIFVNFSILLNAQYSLSIYSTICAYILMKISYSAVFEIFYSNFKIMGKLKNIPIQYKILGVLTILGISLGVVYNNYDSPLSDTIIENIVLGIMFVGIVFTLVGIIFGIVGIIKNRRY